MSWRWCGVDAGGRGGITAGAGSEPRRDLDKRERQVEALRRGGETQKLKRRGWERETGRERRRAARRAVTRKISAATKRRLLDLSCVAE